MVIKVSNPNIDNNVRTHLASPVSAAGVTLTVKNTAGLTQNDYIVIGKIGEDKTELIQITAAVASNTSLTVTAVKFPHGVDTPITYIKYNQIRFYRSTDGTTYSTLTTIAMQVDRLITTYDDVNSATTYYYKSTFYNSTIPKESAFSAILPATGFDWYSLVTLQNRVLDLFPDPKEEIISRSQITDWMMEEYRKLVSLSAKIDEGIFLKTNETSPISLTASTKSYALPVDFRALKKLEIAFNGVTYYRAYPIHVGFGEPNTVYDETSPLYCMLGNTFEIRPTPTSSSGKYKMWYYYTPVMLTNSSDAVDLSLRPYADALVYHALCRAKQRDKDYKTAESWSKETTEVEELMKNELTNRTATDRPRWVEVSDTSFFEMDDGA